MIGPEAKRCLGCGYILEGLPENRCPECGRGFNPRDRRTYYTTPVSGRRYLAAIAASFVALVLAWWLAIVCFQPRADIFIVSSVLLVIVPLAVFVSLGLDTWRAFVGRQHLIEHRLALAVALAIVLVVLGGLGAAALATMFIALGGC